MPGNPGKLFKNRKQKPYWWDREIAKDIEHKEILYQKYLNSNKVENEIEYKRQQVGSKETNHKRNKGK